MRTIDGIVSSGDVKPPDVIKIDVEGAELMVFEGAQKVLATRAPTVVFEADENMMRLGVKTTDLFESLSRAASYAFFLIEPDGALIPAVQPYAFGNYIALSPRHSDRL
jgi:hypothetical protein